MIWMGLLSLTAALLPLYLKYRVVWTGERCRRPQECLSGKNRTETVLHGPRLPFSAAGPEEDWAGDLGVPQ